MPGANVRSIGSELPVGSSTIEAHELPSSSHGARMIAYKQAASTLGVALLALFFVLASCSTAPDGAASRPAWRGCSGSSCVSAGECKPGESSAQFRGQSVPATAIEPGTHTWASVTFDNCSGIDWSMGAVSVHPAPPVDAATWGTTRVMLPANVPNGARVTIPIALQAPNISGDYPFVWRVWGEAAGALEERSKPVTVAVRYSPDCSRPGPTARFQGWSIPSAVAAGQKFTAAITFANCGSVAWKQDTHSLASTIDKPETWGASSIALSVDVPAFAAVALTLELTAPTTQGAFDFAWKVKAGDTPMEEGTPTQRITVLERYTCPESGSAARFVRDHGVPAAMNGNAPLETTETFANCGNRTWDASFHLGAVAPSDDGIWSAGRVGLPTEVLPGYAVTIPIHGRSPSALASYPYRWSIVEDGVGSVDEPSPTRSIQVTCTPSCGGRSCGDDGCGGSCGSCCYQYPFDPSTITDVWGCQASCGRVTPHRGVDFGVPCGSSIPSVGDGTVIANELSSCLGWVIAIQNADGVVTGYAHMPTQSPLSIGTVVTHGQIIGTSGQRGSCAQGCHLHMTMGLTADSWWTGTTFDPIPYIAAHLCP